ncbi:MAG: PHP domain-containing protein, partial [Bacilli bacterium]|nr:PHP domain-containing protein [Bacilli bacterium]
MKCLTINTPLENTDLTSKKARLISVIDDKILVCNYSGFYMLPGGKLDNDETFEEAIIREIKEETQETITPNDIQEYITVDNYQENYLSRKYPNPIKKETKTVYYITDKKINVSEGYLSPLEKAGNMRTSYMKIDTLKSLLKSEVRPKHQVFAQELLKVIEEYEKEHKLIDLHTHTIFSDGEYTPDEVINQARKQNIGTIAITDHDNIEGLKTIIYGKYDDIKVLPGVELTAQVKKGRMHILGYLIDFYNKELNT